MSEIDIEAVRSAIFVTGVRAVDDLCIHVLDKGGFGIAATLAVAAPDVDLAAVRGAVASVLRDQFGIDEVILAFNDPGHSPAPPSGGMVEKK